MMSSFKFGIAGENSKSCPGDIGAQANSKVIHSRFRADQACQARSAAREWLLVNSAIDLSDFSAWLP
jgi:hypothetical protein